MKFKLPLESYQAYSRRENSSSVVNMFSGYDPVGGKTNLVLFPHLGLKNLTDLGGNIVLALLQVHNIGYVVYQGTFNGTAGAVFGSLTLDVNNNPTFTKIGLVGNSQVTTVTMCNSFTQITIATGFTSYVYTLASQVLTPITNGNYPVNALQVVNLNDFTIVATPNSDVFHISNQEDSLTWNALTFASAAVSGNNITALATLYQQLFIFGQTDTEIWSPIASSAPNVPFAGQTGNYLNYGCVAPGSVVATNNTLIWVSEDQTGQGLIMSAQSATNYKIISTDALNFEFATYSTLADAIAFSYQSEGHIFYQITFPSANKTWVYDLTTQMWSEKQSYNIRAVIAPAFTRHRANCYMFLNGIHIVGDFTTGKLFIMDPATFTDDNSYPIPRIIVTPDLTNEGRLVTVNSLELLIEPGQGLEAITQGQNPLISMQLSKDGGFTWGNSRYRNLGQVGQYRQRVKWNLIGQARDIAFKFIMTDPVKFVILGISVDADFEVEVPQSPQKYSWGGYPING